MNKIVNIFQYSYSLFITLMVTLLGEHWLLFVVYLILNIIDTLTGWAKARIQKIESSKIGLIGIIKKMCCWIIVLLGFLIPICFQELGMIIGVDLSITVLLGWFVLASLVVNEIRSIIENLVESGVKVPEILIRGLERISKKLESEDTNNE
ncbi:phage holin family protein [Thomasclavelia sp.]